MTNRTGVELDPSVCYRHPGRQSWVLCQRCGRTICPECQILAPVGVHCPECVGETSGGVQWRPVGGAPAKVTRIRRRSRLPRVRSILGRDSGGPAATWTILSVAVVLWIAGLFTNNFPFQWLAASDGLELQVWRFATASFVYPASLTFIGIFGFLLNGFFLYLNGPQLEQMLGVRRYLAVFAVSAVVGNAFAVLAGGVGYGLISPLFGLFAALLVVVWSDQHTRTQILIMIGINLVINVVVGGGSSLPALVGGMIAGAGATYVFRTAGDRTWKPRTPTLIIAGSAVGFVVLTIIRALLLG